MPDFLNQAFFLMCYNTYWNFVTDQFFVLQIVLNKITIPDFRDGLA
jgi:hypothetical protein